MGHSKVSWLLSRFLDFTWLVFSALGFAFALISIRLFGESETLRDALELQSYVVVLSFIAQLGARALVRRLIYSGQRRLASLVVEFTSTILVALAPFLFYLGITFDFNYYWCVSILLALNTIYLTQSVANRDRRRIGYFSIMNFIIAAYGGLFHLFGDRFDSGEIYMSIELLALILVIVTGACRWRYFPRYGKAWGLYLKLIGGAQSYQLGSVNISLITMLLIQASISVFSQDNEIKAYADLQIVSGFFILLSGKVMLLVEKRIYELSSSRIKYFIGVLLLTFFLSAGSAMYFGLARDVSIVTFMCASWVLYAKTALGYIVQYVSRNRFLLDLLSFLSLFFFFMVWFFVDRSFWFLFLFVYSVTYLYLGYFLIARRRDH